MEVKKREGESMRDEITRERERKGCDTRNNYGRSPIWREETSERGKRERDKEGEIQGERAREDRRESERQTGNKYYNNRQRQRHVRKRERE